MAVNQREVLDHDMLLSTSKQFTQPSVRFSGRGMGIFLRSVLKGINSPLKVVPILCSLCPAVSTFVPDCLDLLRGASTESSITDRVSLSCVRVGELGGS